MPSFWSWLPSRKHRISKSKPPEHEGSNHNEHKPRKYFQFGRNEKEVTKSRYLPFEEPRNIPADNQAGFKDLTHRREPAVEDEVKQERRQLEDIINNPPKRRLLAYEIFQGPEKPLADVNKEANKHEHRSNLKQSDSDFTKSRSDINNSRSDLNNSRSSLNNSCSNLDHSRSDLIEPRLDIDQSRSNLSTSRYNQRQEESTRRDENSDMANVEMRPKNIFRGLPYRMQRHSLQIEYPAYAQEMRKVPDFRRNETMAVYVPRAVSLYDASAILYGSGKEESMPTHSNLLLDRFSKTHERGPAVSQTKPNLKPHSKFQINPPSVERSFNPSNKHVKNLRKPQQRYYNKQPILIPHKQYQRFQTPNHAKPSTNNSNNFYFSCHMLGPILSTSAVAEPAGSGNTNFFDSKEISQNKNASPSVEYKTDINEDDRTNGYAKRVGKNINDMSVPANGNFWFRKSNDSIPDINTDGNHENTASIVGDADSDSDSGLAHIDNIPLEDTSGDNIPLEDTSGYNIPLEDTSGDNIKLLEKIFSTDGEVFY